MDRDQNGHILYQGQRLAATFVSEINLRRGEGMDVVVRDEAGRYYLHREVYKDRRGKSLRGDAPWKQRCPERSRHFLHRLSHAAMALWMIETSGGSRQVRRDAASLWQEPAPQAETLPLVPLGPEASHVLATLCRRQRVSRECVLRSIVEQFLADACQDANLVLVVIDEARQIKRAGQVPEHWWAQGSELPGQSPQARKEAA